MEANIPSEPPIRTVGRNYAILRMFERLRSASYCIFSARRDWKPIASRRLKIFARNWSDGWLPPGYPPGEAAEVGGVLEEDGLTARVGTRRFLVVAGNGNFS